MWPYAIRKQLRRLSRRAAPQQPFTLVFVHIPKTAGISLREALLENTPESRSFRILQPEDRSRLAALSMEERDRLDLVEGHMYYGVHELIGRECRYITLLRDPVERVLSWYSYVCENSWHHLYDRIVGGKLSLADCIQQGVTVELDNHMVRTLAGERYVTLPFGKVSSEMLHEAKANLATFAAVGISERFDESLQLFARTFGWRDARPRCANATKSRLQREEAGERTLDIVRAHNQLDSDLHRFAITLFESSVGA